jgi:sugar (pentulose or hexulose) kinase
MFNNVIFLNKIFMHYCGIDIGTTNTKAVLVSEDGQIIKRLSYSYLPDHDIHRFDVRQWYKIFCDILVKFWSDAGENLIVALATQGASFVLLDDAMQPVDNGWLWTGQSTPDSVAELSRDFGDVKYYRATGWEPSAFLMPCKIKDYIKNTRRSFKHLVTVPDYITSQLTGKVVTDATNAQITGFYDINSQSWREDLVKWTGCEMDNMSLVKNSLCIEFENIKTQSGHISMVTSLHDQYAAMEATGIGIGTIMLGTGTAWVINGKSHEPKYDIDNFCVHPGRDMDGGFGFICTMGPIGMKFDQILNTLGVSYSQLGSIANSQSFFELPSSAVTVKQDGKDSADIIKKYMLTVASCVRLKIEQLGMKDNLKKLVMTGGATANRGWCQMIADVCGVEVEAVDFPELTAYGAAMTAKRAVRQKAFGLDSCNFKKAVYKPVHNNLYKWYEEHQRQELLNNSNGFIKME